MPLSNVLLKKCISCVDYLLTFQISKMFATPVDPERDMCPTYLQVIQKPMDLGTIRKKLENNEYDKVSDFKADIELVWENAITFNGKTALIATLARQLQATFKEKAEFITDDEKEGWLYELNELKARFNNVISSAPPNMQIPKQNTKQSSKKASRTNSVTNAQIPSRPKTPTSSSSSQRPSRQASATNLSESSRNTKKSNKGPNKKSSKSPAVTSSISSIGGAGEKASRRTYSQSEIEKIANKVNAAISDDGENVNKVLELIMKMEPDLKFDDEIEVSSLKLPTLVALEQLVESF
ncbi:Bromodomain containing protein [Tritrichomonas foetus]|uniref:Bromodomain containing protein n=1 Tax=Tritrichomonas foetus TaxID=1144522 RepID=A0A1J4KR15_9EUKA|nr:Bromodomain containing protein [Tritrichomonas foetus]|eukprot:OHT13729.1 Bromodomain containing protein [Tritrichomonas foetus]